MNSDTITRNDPYGALRIPEFRYWLASGALSVLAERGLAVALGYQIYELTHNPLALGILGLVEGLPAIGISLFGGHIADRVDRRMISLVTSAVLVVTALCFAGLSLNPIAMGALAFYAIIFVGGFARGLALPALSAFEAQVVPREYYVNASTWSGSVSQATAILGPALGGFAYAFLGVVNTYLLVAALLALGWILMALIKPKPMPPVEQGESMWQSIAAGVRYVFSSQALWGSMSLDLFAVLFGGAIALLPIFATDVLHVGPGGLGLLVAAPSVGALISMLWATRHPPVENAGKILLAVVAGFGVSIIVFALSQNFLLSLVALGASGLFDGVSMVIRDAILRLMSPESMRGRIASVSWIFIGSSNEIGAFESGIAASILGAVPAVWLGGLVTIAVVAITTVFAPQLRALALNPQVLPEDLNIQSTIVPIQEEMTSPTP